MRFHHFAMEVEDLSKSMDFYIHVLHFRKEGEYEWMGEKIAFLTLGHFLMELIEKKKSGPGQKEDVHLCFEVECLGEITRHLEDNGVQLTEGPYVLDNGWKTLFAEGPDEEVLEFLESDERDGKV